MRALLASAAAKKKCLVPWTQPALQRNLIFSDAYMNIDTLIEKRKKKREARGDNANGHFLRAAHKDFTQNGIRNMLITDTYQMMDVVESEEDLMLVVDVLRTFLRGADSKEKIMA